MLVPEAEEVTPLHINAGVKNSFGTAVGERPH